MRCLSVLLLACTLKPLAAMADTDAGLMHQPAAGISRELATWRSAHYRDVRYELQIDLLPPFERVTGALQLELTLGTTPDLVLDWRPESADHSLHDMRVNGEPLEPIPVADDHVVVPRSLSALRRQSRRDRVLGTCSHRRRRPDTLPGRDRRQRVRLLAARPGRREHAVSVLRPAGPQGALHAGAFRARIWLRRDRQREGDSRTSGQPVTARYGSRPPSRSAPTCSPSPPVPSPSCGTTAANCACWCAARGERAPAEAEEMLPLASRRTALAGSATSRALSVREAAMSCWCLSSPMAAWSTPGPSFCARTACCSRSSRATRTGCGARSSSFTRLRTSGSAISSPCAGSTTCG